MNDDVTPEYILFVPSSEGLGRVLGVTSAAIRKAASSGRIVKRRDGRWDVLAVVDDWRRYTSASQQREGPRWLDARYELTLEDEAELIRRTRAEPGGIVLADEGDGFEPTTDVLDLLRNGRPLTCLALEVELPAAVPNGSWWYAQPPKWGPAIAASLGLQDEAAVRAALFDVMRAALLTLAEQPELVLEVDERA